MSLPHLESVLRRSSLSLHLSPSLSQSHRWRFYNLSAIEIQQTFLNLFAWLHFGRAFSQRASAERGAGANGFRFHGCPQRAHFAFASNIHRLPWLLLVAAAVAAALVVAVVASCPRGGARLAPTVLIFIHSVNMQIARPEPGLACLPWWQQGEPLHHKLQLCWPNSRSSASLPQNLFGQMFFFLFFGQSNMLPHLTPLRQMIRFSAWGLAQFQTQTLALCAGLGKCPAAYSMWPN